MTDGIAVDEVDGPGTVLCDLDGVVWLAHRPIPGAVDAVARLRRAGHRVLFVTNNSAPLVAAHEQALGVIGIPAAGDVLTSAMAAAMLVEPGARVLVCGGEGIVEAVERRGAAVVDPAEVDGGADVDAVVVGLLRDFDYGWLTRAATAVRRGARLIGANEDATYPTPSGPVPGGGAILAAVRTAAGSAPVVAGKPHEPMAALVRATIGSAVAARAVMVGDRPETDGLFARRLGCAYAQVRSGVVAPGESLAAHGVESALDLPDLDAVATALLEGWPAPSGGADH